MIGRAMFSVIPLVHSAKSVAVTNFLVRMYFCSPLVYECSLLWMFVKLEQ